MKWIVHCRIFGRCLLLMRRSLFVGLGLILAGVLFYSFYQLAAASSQNLIYGVGQSGDIVQIELSTGVIVDSATLSFGTQAADQDHTSQYVYYFDRLDSAHRFAYWDPVTRNNVLVRTYASPSFGYPKRLAFDVDNNLYMMNADDSLYQVDKNNGNLTYLGLVTGLVTGGLGGTGDIVFTGEGTLYLNTYANLYTVDLATNQATLVHEDMFGGINKVWSGLAFCDGELYGSAFDFTTDRAVIEHIDITTGDLTEIFSSSTIPINDLTSCPPVPAAVTLSHFQVHSAPLPLWWGIGLLLTAVILLTSLLIPWGIIRRTN